MPYFTKCCCYFKLETGGIILGTMSVFGDIINIGSVAMTLSGSGPYEESFWEGEKGDDDEKIVSAHWIIRLWLIWTLIMSCMMIVCAFLMFYGILYRHRYFLVPYLGCEVIQTCFSFLHLIYLFLVAINPDDYLILGANHHHEDQIWGAIIYLSLNFVLQLYLWFCMYSLFQVYRYQKHKTKVEEDLEREQSGPPLPLVFTTTRLKATQQQPINILPDS